MYKQRDKYFTTNEFNIINRIKGQLNNGPAFTPYEFMALRYACCEQISDIDLGHKDWTHVDTVSAGFISRWNRENKKRKKELQKCILLLDKWYYEHMFKGEQQNG